MLWTLVVILLVLWALGLAFKIAGGLIHILLVIALVVLLVKLSRAGARVGPPPVRARPRTGCGRRGISSPLCHVEPRRPRASAGRTSPARTTNSSVPRAGGGGAPASRGRRCA